MAAELYIQAAESHEVHEPGSGVMSRLAAIEILAGARDPSAAAEASAMLDDPRLEITCTARKRRLDLATTVERVADTWLVLGHVDRYSTYAVRAATILWQCAKYAAAAHILTRRAVTQRTFEAYLRAASMHELNGTLSVAASLRFAAFVVQSQAPRVSFETLAQPNRYVAEKYYPADARAVEEVLAGSASSEIRDQLVSKHSGCRITGPPIKDLVTRCGVHSSDVTFFQ